MKKFLLPVFMIFVSAYTLNAQITLTAQDFQSTFTPGHAFIASQADTVGTVFIGAASPFSQTFDFTSLRFTPIDSLAMVAPQNSPYPDSFPNATVVEEQMNIGSTNVVFYFFDRLTDSAFISYGYILPGNPTVRSMPPQPTTIFPLTLGTQWNYVAKPDTLPTNIYRDSVTSICDGYGTLALSGASYQCLRVKHIETQVHDSGGSRQSAYHIYSYQYYTKEGIIFRCFPYDADTALNTLTRGDFEIFRPVLVASVDNTNILPDGFSLHTYPSPYILSEGPLVINYVVPTSSPTEITLTDALGKTVARLNEGMQSVGEHRVSFHIPSLPAGAYFCTIRAAGRSITQPILIEQ